MSEVLSEGESRFEGVEDLHVGVEMRDEQFEGAQELPVDAEIKWGKRR
jgi:hypothetical protein